MEEDIQNHSPTVMFRGSNMFMNKMINQNNQNMMLRRPFQLYKTQVRFSRLRYLFLLTLKSPTLPLIRELQDWFIHKGTNYQTKF